MRLMLVASLTAVLAACGGGTSGPGGTGGAGGSAGSAGAGGSAGAAGVDKAAAFVGTWTVVSGTLTLTCSNGGQSTSPVTSPNMFSKGIAFDLILASSSPSPSCPGLNLSISGTTATAAAGQQCHSTTDGTTVVLAAYTFMTSDGRNGSEASSGRIDGLVDANTGLPVECPFSETATYQKISN